MNIALEADDFAPLNHRFDLLKSLRDRYKDFKITMFTVAWDIRFEPKKKGTPITEPDYKPWVDEVKKGIDDGWLNIAIHGLTHAPSEFHHLSFDEAKNRVMVAQKMFVNVGIEYVNLFKAPYWQLSKEAKKGVESLKMKVVEDGSYNWNIKDPIPDKDKIIGHGHVQNTVGNGLDESLGRLIKIPASAKWKHLEEML